MALYPSASGLVANSNWGKNDEAVKLRAETNNPVETSVCGGCQGPSRAFPGRSIIIFQSGSWLGPQHHGTVETTKMNSIFFFVLACLCGSGGQCHSFNQVKRRFGIACVNELSSFPSTAIVQPTCLVSNYSMLARGGDNSDVYDEGYDGKFSHLIASFESELFEIRREAEMEAEVEMKKILGLVEQTDTRHDGEDMRDEFEKIPRNEEIKNSEMNEIVHDRNNQHQAQPSGTVVGVDENISIDRKRVEDREGVIDERELETEHSENMENVFVSVQDEKTINDPDEKKHDQENTVEIHEREQHDVDDEEILQYPTQLGTKASSSMDREVNTNRVGSRCKRKSKKRHKPKSKKTRATSMKQHMIILDDTESSNLDETNNDDVYGLSSLSITKQEDMHTLKRGLRYYVQTDLVRTLILFIATIALSIWMQHVQRVMEAEKI